MGHKLHVPFDGRKIGPFRIDDPRAGLARIQIDRGDGKGFVDVTRPWFVTVTYRDESARVKKQVVAADDREGWIAVLDHSTALIVQERGDVKITFEPCAAVVQAQCDHKFVDSTACLKCGWEPAAQTERTQ